jgi:hypothetical protein
MVRYPCCEDLTEDALDLASALPPDDGVAVLLHSLFNHLNRMQRAEVLKVRDEVTKRFGGRYCRNESCLRMLELIDAHLAMTREGASAPIATAASTEPWVSPERRASSSTASPFRIPASQVPPVNTVVVVYSENTGVHQGVYAGAAGWRDMFGAAVNRVTYWWALSAEDSATGDAECGEK